ncbi:MAG: hypothetical protein ACTHN3_07500 [Solirubrobacterales bacterium]
MALVPQGALSPVREMVTELMSSFAAPPVFLLPVTTPRSVLEVV